MACPRPIGSLVAGGARRLPDKPAPAGLNAQIFGRRDSRSTQKAVRFFSERRIQVTFVDLARKQMAPAELRRFTQRFGSRSLMDAESPIFRELGLGYLTMGEDEAFDHLMANQRLLRLPLIRVGAMLAVGADENAWKSVLAEAG